MIRLSLGDLPVQLADAIDADKFLFAYSLPERGRYVARHLGPDGRLEEIEFDVGLGRALTLDERRRALPGPQRTTLPQESLTVVSSHARDEQTAVLRVAIDVLDAAGATIVRVTKQVNDPTPSDLANVVAEALRNHRFLTEYAAWPRDRKVSYWATTVHRFRRVHGESGRDEDEIYTPDLVRDMEKNDPRARAAAGHPRRRRAPRADAPGGGDRGVHGARPYPARTAVRHTGPLTRRRSIAARAAEMQSSRSSQQREKDVLLAPRRLGIAPDEAERERHDLVATSRRERRCAGEAGSLGNDGGIRSVERRLGRTRWRRRRRLGRVVRRRGRVLPPRRRSPGVERRSESVGVAVRTPEERHRGPHLVVGANEQRERLLPSHGGVTSRLPARLSLRDRGEEAKAEALELVESRRGQCRLALDRFPVFAEDLDEARHVVRYPPMPEPARYVRDAARL